MNSHPGDITNILLTGAPGVGKTTIFQRLYQVFADARPVGFYTAETRQGGKRTGFELITFAGQRHTLAHVDFAGPYRVSKYGVDIAGFHEALAAMPFEDPEVTLVMVDEIGKMECYSETFRVVMKKLLDSSTIVMATIALRGGGFIAEVKRRPDVVLFELTRRNQERLVSEITVSIQRQL